MTSTPTPVPAPVVAGAGTGTASGGRIGPLSTAVRLGGLFGPSVFGVTAAAVALPKVAAALGAAPAEVAWVLTAHALALGVGTAVFGRLADSRGARAALPAASLLLAAGALVCLAAPSLGVLVGGRLLLAAGSGGVAAVGAALLAGVDPGERGRVLAGYGMVMAVFASVATLLGGVVTTWLSWRVTLVLPVLSVVAAPFCLRLAVRPGSRRPIDVAGAAALTAAVSTLLVIVQSRTLGLGGPVVLGLVAGFVPASGALVWRVARRPDGFVPRALVGAAVHRIGAAIGVGVFAGLFAAMYVIPQILAGVHGWSVLTIGVALLPGAAVGAVLSRRAGLLSARGGRLVLAGTAVAAAAALAVTATGRGGPWPAVAAASLCLAAFALTQVVIIGDLSARLPPALRGAGMGLLNLTFFVGGGLGSAVTAASAVWLGTSRAPVVVALFPLLAALVAVATRARADAPAPPPAGTTAPPADTASPAPPSGPSHA
ncbi:MFS transporter [Nonomuraea roseoviolacea]|uniref:MFS family permease n=1 Tax=Nonomuraea roseoviolacea subsp. carminata TaxID=160689 RepID=A0ABT1K8M8_9ACTN|nr:MFS transporter [Nonomuraea roseoviolacea]MCP2349959.1 MFS family permease [Nonomuraea roseoviolacea subsp. carminata]